MFYSIVSDSLHAYINFSSSSKKRHLKSNETIHACKISILMKLFSMARSDYNLDNAKAIQVVQNYLASHHEINNA